MVKSKYWTEFFFHHIAFRLDEISLAENNIVTSLISQDLSFHHMVFGGLKHYKKHPPLVHGDSTLRYLNNSHDLKKSINTV